MIKEQNSKNKNKALHIGGVILRKFLPYTPIIGMPLTLFYHCRFGDTGIENNTTSWISAFIQAVSILGLFYYAISATYKNSSATTNDK